MIFGENPRDGFFVQNTFYHPELEFSIAYPRGWKVTNQRQAVGAVSQAQDAVLVLSLARGTSADQAARQFFNQQGLRPAGAQRDEINGMPAVSGVFEAVSGQTPIAGRVSFVEYGGKVYRLLGYTPHARWRTYQGLFDQVIGSFRRLTDRRYLDVQPRRIDVVDLDRPTPVTSLASRASVGADVLALINGVPAGGTLPADEAKIVVGGRLPGSERSAR
jgi:predicted Zn-dependent protease